MLSVHRNFRLSLSGLHINPAYPHLGASPDGIVSCDCCGEGVVEIKCPYNERECSLQNGVENVDFLEQSADGLHLKETHVYYYQVQA